MFLFFLRKIFISPGDLIVLEYVFLVFVKPLKTNKYKQTDKQKRQTYCIYSL